LRGLLPPVRTVADSGAAVRPRPPRRRPDAAAAARRRRQVRRCRRLDPLPRPLRHPGPGRTGRSAGPRAALAPVARGSSSGAGPAPPELRLLLFARTRSRHAAQPGPRGSRGGPAGRPGRGPLRVLRPGLPVRRGGDRGAVPPWADGAGANRAAVGGGAGGWRPQGSDPERGLTPVLNLTTAGDII